MAVPHYDDVYGELLDTHVAAELSAEVATGLQSDSTPFTDIYKTRLTVAVSRAIVQRKALCESLETEQASLETGLEGVSALLDELDGPRIPAWYTTEFEERLDELAKTRQQTLQTRTQLGQTDAHDLCTYLYDDREWTYPVLTAIARLRNAVEY